MLRKVLFGALTLLLALGLVGCGNKGGDAGKTDTKTEAVAVEGTADKAVLAYAQLYTLGAVDDAGKQATGLTDDEIAKAKTQALMPVTEAFKQYPLSDESVATMTGEYLSKLASAMQISTKVKTEDKEHPVVELTATTINPDGIKKLVEENADLTSLAAAFGELQAQGLTVEQLKESPDFQQFALESVKSFVNEFPLNEAATVDVTCTAIKGSDGKMYWAPEKVEDVAKFVAGQK